MLKALASRLRPAEWVVLAFVLYALVRVVVSAQTHSFSIQAFPRADVAVTLLSILTVRLAIEYREAKWQDEGVGKRHWIALPILVVPSVVVVFARRELFAQTETGTLAPIIDVVRIYAIVSAYALAPPVFLWLFSGLEMKRRGSFGGLFLFGRLVRYLLTVGRDWVAPLALIYAYVFMSPVLAHQMVPDQDQALAAIDRALFLGRNPNELCEHIIRPWLSEWLAGSYIFYAVLFPLGLGVAYVRDNRKFRELAFAATFALAVGYVGYTLVPAQGPLFTMTFKTPLDLYYLGAVKEELMDRMRVPRDCFPSLHTCVSFVFEWGIIRAWRPLGLLLLPVVLSIPFACVYLRYHYVTDILAGTALFLFTAWLAPRVIAKAEAKPEGA